MKTNVGNDRGAINVLVTRFSAPGDVAMTVPVLYSACRCYPDVHFVMATRPRLVGVFVNAPKNLTVLGLDIDHRFKGISGMRRLVKYLCDHYHIDTCVDLHNNFLSRIADALMRLRGVRVARINRGGKGQKALTRRRNKVMLPLISQRSRYREALFRAGLPVQEHFQGLYGKGGKADPSLFASITGPKPEGKIWIGIAPFAAYHPKEYPSDLMRTVIAQLYNIPGVRLFMLGGAGDEADRARSLTYDFPSIVNLVGKHHGIDVEIALLSHFDAMVTMDSFNMHLASIARTPTVSIWGATHPYCGFKGWHQSDSHAVQLPLTCRPCSVFGNRKCFRGDFLCMKAIRPETVISKIFELVPSLKKS